MMSREWWDENRDKWYCNPGAIVAMVLGGLIIAALFAFLFGWLVMLLWNWLMPAIFGLPSITYWQGWGLVLLSHILLKGGWGHGGGGRGHSKGRKRHWCGPDGRPWEGDRGVKDDIAARVSGESKDDEEKNS
jgi:hypothetical protein